MSAPKQRITVTVDPEWIAAAQEAVDLGTADSVSSWVNQALEDRATKERKLQGLRAAIADYEAEFGEITEEEMAEQRRRDRENSTIIRGGKVIRRATPPS